MSRPQNPTTILARAATFLLLASSTFHRVEAVAAPLTGVAINSTCNLARNRLTSTSHQFLSDCIATAYCDPTELICKPRGCRTEEFPFGYAQGADLPPLCGQGTFCPDEGDQCLPLLAVGENCQMDRDDECTPMPGDSTTSDWNNHGAICLQFTCYWANVTLGNSCVVDNTVYTGYRTNTSEFATIISRDNCQSPGLFCNAQTSTCQAALDIAAACQADKMCLSHNCGPDNTCIEPAGTVKKLSLFEYIITGVGIIAFIVIILVILFLIHRKHRAQSQKEIREYYHEQTTYRSSIIALHTAARERTSSLFSRSESQFSNYDEHGQMIYRDDDSQRQLIGSARRRGSQGAGSSNKHSRLRDSMVADEYDSDDDKAQAKGLLAGGMVSRDSFETPRQSFDYGQPGSSSGAGGYSAVAMRQSVELPIGASAPKRGTNFDFKDPWDK